MWALLFSNPKNLLVLALITALGIGVYAYGEHKAADGYHSGSVAQLSVDQDQFKQVTTSYQSKLDSEQQQLDASTQQIALLQTSLKTLSAQYASLAAQRQQSQSQVNALPDAALQADLEAKLGGPLSSSTTLRKADSIVTDYPLVLQQVTVLNNKVDNLSGQVSALNTSVTAVTAQRDAAIAYGNTVTGYYVKAYNAAQVHHSKLVQILTLGIVHNKHLDLPAPTTLKP